MGEIIEKLGLSEELFINGKLESSRGKHESKLIGVVEVYNGLTGSKLFTFNDVILPGATYVLEQFFKKRSTFAMTTLSTDLGIKADIAITQENLKNELTFGFVVGIGGSDSANLIKAVKFKDKSVDTIVPLRVVPITADLSASDQAKYALKKTVGSNYYYYAKKFDTDIVIRHLFTDGTEIPPNINETDTNLGLLVFGEMVFTISTADLREYFINVYGNIDNCRFNSIGLVTGFLDGTDYAGVRVTTKINLRDLYLSNSENYFRFIYKLYSI